MDSKENVIHWFEEVNFCKSFSDEEKKMMNDKLRKYHKMNENEFLNEENITITKHAEKLTLLLRMFGIK